MGKATKRPKGSNNNKTKQQRGGTAPWPKQPAATAGTDDTKGPPKSTSSKGGRQHQHHQHLLPSPRLVQLPMRILHLVVVYIAGPRPTPTGVPPPSPLPLAFSCRTMHDVVFSCTLLWLTPTPLELLQCPGAALVWHPPGPPPSDRATAFARLIAWRPRTLDLSRFTRTEQVTVLRRASAPLRAAVAHVRFPAYAQTHDAFRPAALLAMVLYPRSFPGLCALSISLWTLRGVRSDWADTGLATVVQPVRLVIEGHPPPHDVPVLDVVLDAWAGRMSQFLGGTGSGSKDASSSSLAAALRAGSMLPSTAIPVSAIVPTAFPHLVASIPKSSPYLSWTKCRHCKVRFASAGSKTCTPVDPETAAAPRSRRSVATVHRLTSVSRSHGGRTITHAVAAAPSPQSIPKQPNTKPTDGTDPDPMPVPAWYMDAVADAAEDELPGPDGARMVDARDPNVTLAEATAYYPCPGELDPRAFLAGAGPGSHHGCGCGVVASSNGNHHHHHGSSSLSSSSSSTSSSSSSMSEGRRGTAHDDDDDDDDDDDEGISQPCTHSMNQHYHRRGTPASATGFHGGPPPGLCEHFIEERLVPELATSPTTAANGTAIDASIVPVMPHADFQIVHDACMESDHGPPRPAAPATVPCNALVRRGLCFACLVRYEPDVQQCAVCWEVRCEAHMVLDRYDCMHCGALMEQYVCPGCYSTEPRHALTCVNCGEYLCEACVDEAYPCISCDQLLCLDCAEPMLDPPAPKARAAGATDASAGATDESDEDDDEDPVGPADHTSAGADRVLCLVCANNQPHSSSQSSALDTDMATARETAAAVVTQTSSVAAAAAAAKDSYKVPHLTASMVKHTVDSIQKAAELGRRGASSGVDIGGVRLAVSDTPPRAPSPSPPPSSQQKQTQAIGSSSGAGAAAAHSHGKSACQHCQAAASASSSATTMLGSVAVTAEFSSDAGIVNSSVLEADGAITATTGWLTSDETRRLLQLMLRSAGMPVASISTTTTAAPTKATSGAAAAAAAAAGGGGNKKKHSAAAASAAAALAGSDDAADQANLATIAKHMTPEDWIRLLAQMADAATTSDALATAASSSAAVGGATTSTPLAASSASTTSTSAKSKTTSSGSTAPPKSAANKPATTLTDVLATALSGRLATDGNPADPCQCPDCDADRTALAQALRGSFDPQQGPLLKTGSARSGKGKKGSAAAVAAAVAAAQSAKPDSVSSGSGNGSSSSSAGSSQGGGGHVPPPLSTAAGSAASKSMPALKLSPGGAFGSMTSGYTMFSGKFGTASAAGNSATAASFIKGSGGSGAAGSSPASTIDAAAFAERLQLAVEELTGASMRVAALSSSASGGGDGSSTGPLKSRITSMPMAMAVAAHNAGGGDTVTSSSSTSNATTATAAAAAAAAAAATFTLGEFLRDPQAISDTLVSLAQAAARAGGNDSPAAAAAAAAAAASRMGGLAAAAAAAAASTSPSTGNGTGASSFARFGFVPGSTLAVDPNTGLVGFSGIVDMAGMGLVAPPGTRHVSQGPAPPSATTESSSSIVMPEGGSLTFDLIEIADQQQGSQQYSSSPTASVGGGVVASVVGVGEGGKKGDETPFLAIARRAVKDVFKDFLAPPSSSNGAGSSAAPSAAAAAAAAAVAAAPSPSSSGRRKK